MTDSFDQKSANAAVMDVDRLLGEFYRSEMPSPWPRLALPRAVSGHRPASRVGGSFLRFALAASVVVALFGYWTLAGLFPQQGPAAGLPPAETEIGKALNHHQLQRNHLVPLEQQKTPGGAPANVF